MRRCMNMASARFWKRASVSVLFLTSAAIGTVLLVRPYTTTTAQPSGGEDGNRTIVRAASSLLGGRAFANWGTLAAQAGDNYGEEGIEVLELFGDEAAFCLQRNPDAFEDLVQVVR